MRKMAVGLVVATALILAMTGGPAWAQGADPLGLISTGAVMPYFNVSAGNLFFLLMASPVGDNSNTTLKASDGGFNTWSSHLWFYSAACVRENSLFVPQTENDTAAYLLNGKTSLTEGAVLIAGTSTGIDQKVLNASIFVRGVWIDLAANKARLLDPAAGTVMSMDPCTDFSTTSDCSSPGLIEPVGTEATTSGDSASQVWSPYDTGGVLIFMPPDDGTTFFDRVIFSCPIGTSVNNLSKDMQNLMRDNQAAEPTDVIATAAWQPRSSVTLQAVVYDDNETPINDWTRSCSCVFPPTRLSVINPVYASATTYTEIRSTVATSSKPVLDNTTATDLAFEQDFMNPRFLGYQIIGIQSGGTNVELFGRIHHGPAQGATGGADGIFDSKTN